MIRAAIYTTATGQIQRIIEGESDQVAANVGSGETSLEVASTVQASTHYIVSGVATAFSAASDPTDTWNWSTHSWDTATLTAYKDAKWVGVKAAMLANARAKVVADLTYAALFGDSGGSISPAAIFALSKQTGTLGTNLATILTTGKNQKSDIYAATTKSGVDGSSTWADPT